VSILALETHDKLAVVRIPDTDALIEGTGSNEAVVGGDSDGCDAVLDGQVENLLVGLEVPKAYTSVAASRRDDTAVAGEIERVDVLLVTSELVFDGTSSNIPDLHELA
jgi:hypothetical protein